MGEVSGECGTEVILLHCRPCHEEGLLSAAMRVIQHAQQMEVYCLSCGLPIVSFSLGDRGQVPILFPNGMPQDRCLKGLAANPMGTQGD